ncbi:hypothetical protein [Helicobacter pylori]|uniref:hypothetical protein n=1 Tax=Helicobacter pylori TaxID=210 RepID=UPI000C30AB5E|nr:hypothetical protein [Helicobacter pylori]WRE46216.1 hypothetical protein KVD60_00915 [Helicobacter pylori]
MDSKECDGFLTNGQNIRELKQSNSIYKVGVGEKNGKTCVLNQTFIPATSQREATNPDRMKGL